MATKTEYHPDGSTTEWVSADSIAELEQRVKELEKVEKAARNLLLQLNEGSVDDECLAADELDEALEALEGGKQDG